MAAPYGVQPTGFVQRPVLDLLAALQADQTGVLGADFDVSAESPEGAINAGVATQVAQLYELGAAVYDARNPNAATFQQLDDLCLLTGTQRQPATFGTVTLTVNLAAGAMLPAGAVASVTGDASNQWATTAPAVNASGSAADVAVAAQATTAGLLEAAAGSIAVIVTPFAGWNSVTNAVAAVPGLAADSDAALRLRRQSDLSTGTGSGADALVASLRAALTTANPTAPTYAAVYTNPTTAPLVLDGQTIPPFGMLVLVYDGTLNGSALSDAAIAALIWAGKPSGVSTLGITGPMTATSVMTPDAQGDLQPVAFFRPAQTEIYLALVTTHGPAWDGTNTPAAIQAALVAYGAATYTVGASVVRSYLFGVIEFDPTQVADTTTLNLGTSPSPSGTANLSLGALHLAVVSATNITVT